MILNSREVIAESGIAFGTSGARGLVTDFTSEVCEAFSHAFISVMQANYPFDKVALGIDLRPSSYAMARYCADALLERGIEPIYYGVLPTPALAYSAMQDNIPAIMVTGSHIPFDRNGLKFYRPDGEISKTDEETILSIEALFKTETNPKERELEISTKATDQYIERYESFVPRNALAGKRIGVYEHSSAGREIYAKLFENLGAVVVSLGRSDEFVPIDTEAVSEKDHQQAQLWSKQHQLDAIFSTDGDGDRPLLADENGHWLRGDILGLLCAKLLNIEALAIPINCNTAIELSCLFKNIIRTRIGSPYVIEAIAELSKRNTTVAGFEANGGFILSSKISNNNKELKPLPTRDALLPAITVMANCQSSTISKITKELPNRFTASDRIENYPTSKSKLIIDEALTDLPHFVSTLGMTSSFKEVNLTDGLRITLIDDSVVHFRPSGNSPELRCYAESNTSLSAEKIVKKTISKLSALF